MFNDLLVYNIVYCIAYVFNGFIVYTFMSTFFNTNDTKCNGLVIFIGYTIYVFLTSVVYFLWNIAILNLTANVICLIGITFLYKSSAKDKLLAVCYTYFFLFSTEIIVYLLTGYATIPIFEHGYYRDILGAIICRVLAFIAALLLKNFKAIKNNQEVPASLWISSIFVPVSTMIIQTIIIYYVSNRYVLITSVCMVVLLNVVSFSLYDALNKMYCERIKSALIEQEKEFYHNQCLLMQTSVEEMKMFRHDINNHFSTLYEMIEENDYDESKHFIEKLISINHHGFSYSQSGNIIIDSILNYKLRNFESTGIHSNVEVSIPANLNLDAADMTTILSNMIDNALEALKTCETKTYEMKIIYAKGSLIIYQKNSYNGKVHFEGKKIISSKLDKTNHGYGLNNIEATAKKYGGLMRVRHDSNFFSTDVLLYIDLQHNK